MARHVPRAIADVIQKALQVDPDARFQTAAEMRSAIEACIVNPTPPETVAACLRELLGIPLDARRQEIRQAIEESNRRTLGQLGVASHARPQAPQPLTLPMAPPELAHGDWPQASTRMRASAWAMVALTTLLLLGVWVRVVMLGVELRRVTSAHVRSS